MIIDEIREEEIINIAPLVALFRVELKQLKGISSLPDENSGFKELKEYIESDFPCFSVKENDDYLGYIVCRIEESVVWVESIFVKKEYRKKGVATKLFRKAEKLAKSFGEDTVYNYVHPNNNKMISFLKKHEYSVLNLIEIRKPFKGEKLRSKIIVGENEFDY